ncbi:hypothetical protein I314_06506 [Cryptococcus bacillisporus CA1873]|uniref:Uncharacterized protein n=1 Tax=Cryptococcus bacillisporus CA1873 TaxID=1296111 RepID=A0ABR5B1Z5_CRYGA|nr:hypothetical protein I314_06506 [Cryptococcus bacillisporus CA1873]|eukprot:KIR57614.1 hypothetical protein I314_06506 [Cryptococcus gattii CA1873]
MNSATHVPPPNTTPENRLAAVSRIQTRGWHGGFVHWEIELPDYSLPVALYFYKESKPILRKFQRNSFISHPPFFLYRANVCHRHPEGTVDEAQARRPL